MSGTILPTLYRTIAPVAVDPDWAAKQVAPTETLTLDRRARQLGIVAVAEDVGGAAVPCSLELQTIVTSRTVGDPDRTELVAGSVVGAVTGGSLYVIDVDGFDVVALRVVSVSAVGAVRLKLYWRVVR